MPRTLAALAFLAALAASVSGAQAASQKLWSACSGNIPADEKIRACSKILAGKESRQNRAIAFNNRGYAYDSKGDHDRAIADLTRAIELDPKNAYAFNNRSLAYYHKRDYDRAIGDATRAIELDPKNAYAFTNRGNAYYHKRDADRALADLTRAIELDPKHPYAFATRAVVYWERGDYDRAITDANRAIELDPKDAVAFNNRGNAYYSKGDHDRAIADYNRAIELDPKYASAFSNRGSAYDSKGDHDRAIADLTRAIELDPKNAYAFNNRGNAYDSKGDHDRAIADLTRAIELDPKYAMAFNNRGFAYNEKGDYDRAIADLTRAIELDPKNANPYRHRGLAYLQTGELDLARVDLTKALELKPDYPEAKATLAELEKAEAAAKAPASTQQAAVEPAKPAEAAPAPAPVVQPATSPAATSRGKRVALVIGNSGYEQIAALKNPKNDADAVAAALTRLGFEVVEGTDLTHDAFAQTVRDFSRALAGADAAVLFYAGHSLQVGDRNYLAPVDAKLESEADLDFEMVQVETILTQMEREPRVNIVFLDACRDNPLARNLARSMGTRSAAIGRGLARIESGIGTLIAFATQPGNVALDGEGAHSPFTAALLKHIETPGLDVAALMRQVRQEVITATSNRQVPWDHSSLTANFVFNPATMGAQQAPAPSSPVPAPQPPAPDPALAAWNATKGTESISALEAFIARFGDSFYADLARIKLEALKAKETEKKLAVVAPPAAPVAPAKPQSIELEALLQMFMLPAGADYTSGDWQAGSTPGTPIDWEHAGLKDCDESREKQYGAPFCRTGTVQLSIGGAPTHSVLRKIVEPGRWKITLMGARAGVSSVSIEPDVFSGELEPSLLQKVQSKAANGLKLASMKKCEGLSGDELFRVSSPQKQTAFVQETWSCGASNCSTSFTLTFSKDNAERLMSKSFSC